MLRDFNRDSPASPQDQQLKRTQFYIKCLRENGKKYKKIRSRLGGAPNKKIKIVKVITRWLLFNAATFYD